MFLKGRGTVDREEIIEAIIKMLEQSSIQKLKAIYQFVLSISR